MLEQFLRLPDLLASAPLLLLLVLGLVLMMVDAFGSYKVLPWVTGLGLLASAALAWPGWLASGSTQLHYANMIAFGGLAGVIHLLLCLTGLFSTFFVADYFTRRGEPIGEAYPLLVFALLGAVMLATGNDLIVVFIGLEIMSVCLYIMASLFKREIRSNEAGLKYFLLGAFATGFLLYGIALIYGITGTTQLDTVGLLMQNPNFDKTLLYYPAFALVLVGFLFKVAAFPFHAWTPDVYTGSPTPMTGFMATVSKLAAFTAFSFFLYHFMPTPDAKVLLVLGVLAAASMAYGNIVASRQSNLKRMLAFSSIAHTGYVLLGLCAGPDGYSAVLFYMFVYSVMSIGAFGVIAMVEQTDGDAEIERWQGLAQRQPWLAVAMAVFLFSLAGVPPLAGFMSKYLIFSAAVNAELYVLAVLGVLTSVVGAFYYLRVIVYMFFRPAEAPAEGGPASLAPVVNRQALWGAGVLAVILLVLGVVPTLVSGVLDGLYARLPEVTALVR